MHFGKTNGILDIVNYDITPTYEEISCSDGA